MRHYQRVIIRGTFTVLKTEWKQSDNTFCFLEPSFFKLQHPLPKIVGENCVKLNLSNSNIEGIERLRRDMTV